MKAKLAFVAAMFVGLCACGGTSCTITVSGDAASGVQNASIPCGSPREGTSPNGGFVIGPVVEAQFSLSPGGAAYGASMEITVGGSPTRQATLSSDTIGTDLLPTTITESTSLARTFVKYEEAPPPGSPYRDWLADDGSYHLTPRLQHGSFTILTTSRTPTALSDCGPVRLFLIHCLRLHGRAHATLPADPVLQNNSAQGTVVIDVTF